MKKIFTFIFLFSSLGSYSQQAMVWLSTPPVMPAYSSLSVQANTITDSRIDVRWDDVGADSYTVTRNSIAVSGSPFSAGTSSFSDTGLAVNTSYTYIVSAVKSGYSNSTATDVTSTLTYTPVFLGLFHGAISSNQSSSNSYTNQNGITKGGNRWDRLASFVGSNYLSVTAAVGFRPGLSNDSDSPYQYSEESFVLPGNNWSPPYLFNTQISFAADFTILWSEPSPMGTGQTLFTKTGGVDALSYSHTNVVVRINSSNATISWPGGSKNSGKHLQIFGVKRVGAFVYAWDGTTWGSGVACNTTTFVIDSYNPAVTQGGYYHGFCLVASGLSDSQVNEFFNIWKRSDYTSAADNASPTVTNANFATSLTTGGTGNYLPYSWMGNASGGGFKTVNSVSQGDYTFFVSQSKADVTNKLANRVFIRRHSDNKLSDPFDLGYYTYDYDGTTTAYDQLGHYTPSLLNYDNKLHVLQYFPHYDQGPFAQLETIRTAPDFNFINLKKWSPWKGQSNYIAQFLAYPRVIRYQDKIIKVSASWNLLHIYHQPTLEISTDNLNTWDFNRIFDLSGSNADIGQYVWGYPYLVHNGGTNSKIILIVNFFNLNGTYMGWAICYSDASSPYVFRNWNNTFSKDISDQNPITWAEMKTNFIFTLGTHGLQSFIYGAAWSGGTPYALNDLASTGTGATIKFWRSKENGNVGNSPAENSHWTQANGYQSAVTSCYMDGTGEIFGMAPDYVGGDGYLSMFYGTPGSSMTFKTSNNFALYNNGVYQVQLVKEGSGYSVYGTNTTTAHQVAKWTTSTKGTSWTSVGVITDGSHYHEAPMVNENHAFNGNIHLYCGYGTDAATPLGLWIK